MGSDCISSCSLLSFYLVYKLKNIVGRTDFSDQLKKKKKRKKKKEKSYVTKRIGYNTNIKRQSACLCITQSRFITLLPSLLAYRWVGRQTKWWPRHKAIYFSRLGPERFLSIAWPPEVQLLVFLCFSVPVVLFDTQGISRVGRYTLFLLFPYLCFIIVFICDLIVSRDDPLMS